MTDGITGSSGTTSTAGTSTSTTTTKKKSDNEMNKDMFLKLLVAQMKNQDPSSPQDSSQFMAQTAQFTMVEKLEALETATQKQTATGLVGKTVSYNTGSDTATGTVDSLRFEDDGPVLKVGNKEIPLASVTGVVNATTGTSSTGTSTTGTSTTGTTTPTT